MEITRKREIIIGILLLFFSLLIPGRVMLATDAKCTLEFQEVERGQIVRQSKCQTYFDVNTGKVLPGMEYLKCYDNVLCDPEPNPDPNAKPVVAKRCCIEVPQGTRGIGTYGGRCKDPGAIDRNSLPFDSGASTFIDLKPANCKVDDTAVSPQNEDVYVIPPTINGDEQTLEAYAMAMKQTPQIGKSAGNLPVLEDNVTVYNWEPIAQTFSPPKQVTWPYEVDNGFRRYFLGGRAEYYLQKRKILVLDRQPNDPRPKVDGGLLGVGNLGCVINNAAKKILFAGLAKTLGMVTNNENMPDITLLCSEGIPLFDDPSQVTIDGEGNITGFDAANCHCVDENASPGNAAVLLCTRFIAGIGDRSVPWRSVLPVPDANGVGSQRYHHLLFGHIVETNSIDEFQNGVARETREFFNSDDEVPAWISQLVKVPNDLLKTRFFGEQPWPTDPSDVNEDAFKSNHFVRQYISCLSCAKYGGFPTALGCMPADRVDRFLAEGVLSIGIGIAGAVAVLCIIYGAIQFQLSEGEAAKVQKAQKLITQCILGLLLILFSVFLLRFVGVNLLRIYGLG